ncbi:complex I NDUFA9 subunit family protein [Rhodopila sp.]|uniref:complex I NDUFA9 subunit family protein n=1 Tax=Rhodopila sp. TaxID=2480087 RepID=UPI003D099F09
MATRRVATIFGGSGFIGRYVVKRLAQQGFIVRVPSRQPEAALFLKPMGAVGQIVPLFASIGNEATVHRAVEGAEVVVNLVGALTESGAASFQAVHAEGSQRIARLAAAAGVGQLIQISAIGADPNSPSRYASSKGRAEQAVLAAFPQATVLRPSLVFGIEDKFFNRFAEIARLSPFMPVISGDTRMQPVYVCDVADAVMAARTSSASQGKVFELGGPRVWTFREILAYILKATRRERRLVDIPMGIARLQASILQHVPGKPLTPDQLLMLSNDNIVSPGALGLADLGITPTPVELVVPGFLSRFQPGGGRRPTIPTPLER